LIGYLIAFAAIIFLTIGGLAAEDVMESRKRRRDDARLGKGR